MPRSRRRPPNRRTGSRASRRPAEPSLEEVLADLLAEPHPLGFLMQASSLAEVLDDEESGGDLVEFAATLAAADSVPTHALLVALDALLPGRIPPHLLGHRQPLPTWLGSLQDARVVRALILLEPGGGTDQLTVEAVLPGGALISLLALVDHWAGSAVTDALLAPFGIDEVLDEPLRDAAAAGVEVRDLRIADAGRRLLESADAATWIRGPSDSGSWPQARPLLRWLAGLAPAGGRGWPVESWSPKALQGLTAAVVEGPGTLIGPDADDVVLTLVGWATQHAPFGHPLHWSARAVEEVLDWIDGHVVADDAWHEQVPRALQALVEYAVAEGVLPENGGADALAALEELTEDDDEHLDLVSLFGPAAVLRDLALEVGGERALDELTVEPGRRASIADVPEDLRLRLDEVLALVRTTGGGFFEDDELVDVATDLLVRVGIAAPTVLTRRGDPRMTAAAALWIAGKVNGAFARRRVQDLMTALGLKGSPSQRAAGLIGALGLGGWSGPLQNALGDPGLLTTARRADLVRRRDSARAAPPDMVLDDEGFPTAVRLPGGTTTRVERRPGLAAEVMDELRPFLEEQGVDIDDEPDLDVLRDALEVAQDARNAALFTPTGRRRAAAAGALRAFAEALDDGDDEGADGVLADVEPAAPTDDVPEVAAVIGLGLELLDDWLGTAAPGVPIGLAAAVRLPREWRKRARPGVEVVALASRGRAHSAHGALIGSDGGLQVLTAVMVAVGATAQAWASRTAEPLPAVLARVVR